MGEGVHSDLHPLIFNAPQSVADFGHHTFGRALGVLIFLTVARGAHRSGRGCLLAGIEILFIIIFIFCFALRGSLGGSWDPGLGLKRLPVSIAFTRLNISPISFTQHASVKVFGWDLRPWNNSLLFKRPEDSHDEL